MSNNKFCLQCDDGTLLEHARRNLSFTYRDHALTVPEVSGWHCPACGECEFDDGEGKRYSDLVDTFCASIDHEIADSLRVIRKKLGLRQSDAGKLFGGGATAFSEYERGKTQPHKSTVLLLKLLDKHPELLDELRAT
ncbi:MAG: type II toxin-antitoxin system MqsA family antitoxin [Gallionella sp.]|nr:type II toxin-antitoxin system MqsA family antitoxin [Gallionella sp.]